MRTHAQCTGSATRSICRSENFKVIIIGAGFAGLCAGIRLKELGIPFVILEKNQDVGGTWLENDYPGCAVDTPNHFYSYSFNPNDKWSRHFSRRDEILAYIDAHHRQIRSAPAHPLWGGGHDSGIRRTGSVLACDVPHRRWRNRDDRPATR